MKVLYPILHYPPVIGGLEQWSQNIAVRQPADTKILIVTGRVEGEPNFEQKNNVSIFRTSLFALGDLSYSSLFYITTAVPFIFLRSLLVSRKVQMFHCHGFVSAIAGYFLSALTGKPFVCTEQSIKLRNPISKLASGIIYRKAVICIASSHAVAEEFRKIGAKRVEIIPNGVDLDLFANRHESTANHSDFTILSVGRLEKVKGHTHLINAFAQVKKEIPQIRLILVGEGSERSNLEKQADELGVRGAIEFAGEIPHNDLPRWYHKADVFVMPSLSEGFGITAIEAMSAEIPVIASRVGGLLDIIEDGKNGEFAEAGNSRDIARAIYFLYATPQKARILARYGINKAQEYSWDQIAPRVTTLYRELI